MHICPLSKLGRCKKTLSLVVDINQIDFSKATSAYLIKYDNDDVFLKFLLLLRVLIVTLYLQHDPDDYLDDYLHVRSFCLPLSFFVFVCEQTYQKKRIKNRNIEAY